MGGMTSGHRPGAVDRPDERRDGFHQRIGPFEIRRRPEPRKFDAPCQPEPGFGWRDGDAAMSTRIPRLASPGRSRVRGSGAPVTSVAVTFSPRANVASTQPPWHHVPALPKDMIRRLAAERPHVAFFVTDLKRMPKAARP